MTNIKNISIILAVMVLLGLVGFQSAMAEDSLVIKKNHSDNDELDIALNSSAGAKIGGNLAGLAPFQFGTPGEIAALAADINLKHTPAVLDPPLDLEKNVGIGQCFFNVTNNTDAEGNYYNFSEDQSSLFYIKYNSLENAWSDLGSPTVFHPDAADVSVSVSNPYFSLANNMDMAQFPEGRHRLVWRANTSSNYFFDVAIPLALIASTTYSETELTWKVIAEEVAKKIAKKGGNIGTKIYGNEITSVKLGLAADLGLIDADVNNNDSTRKAWYNATMRVTAINEGEQILTVWDNHPPYFQNAGGDATIVTQDITLEARDYGGIRFSRVRTQLEDQFNTVDDCGRELRLHVVDPPLLLPTGTQSVITWEIQDGGPYQTSTPLESNQTLDGDNIYTTLAQRITVEDTQAPLLVPPAGFARYSDTPIDLTTGNFDLGKLLVADLADPHPQVSDDAPAVLQPDRRYAITYTATDASGNETIAPADDPGKYTQIVTVKSPGTNTAPTAFGASASTITSQPVSITLTGEDTDFIDDRFDPLAFKVVQRPPNGEFVAPLLPYFIEDFRPKPETVAADTTWETLECPADRSDGRMLEAKLGMLGTADHSLYVHKCFNDSSVMRVPPPRNFIYQPRYVHINNAGAYFMSDSYWRCDPNGCYPEPRVSKFIDGELHAEFVGEAGFDGVFQVDSEDNLWWTELVGSGSSTELFIKGVSTNLVPLSSGPDGAKYDASTLQPSEHPIILNAASLVNSHVDSKRGVVYVYDKSHTFMFDFDDPTHFYGLVGGDSDYPCDGFDGYSQGGYWMETDSEGNLYQVCNTHVQKFGPPKMENGNKTPGDYIGWLGKCTANKSVEGVPYNDCDVETQSSKGFQCTDATCEQPSGNDVGDGPGQFDQAIHLTIDPNDVLYVVDHDNYRVQRFSPDGTFAGQAMSTGEGVSTDGSFVVGNMGRPRHVSVNSQEFHVLESQPSNGDYFLHIFKTLPFYDITDNSAKVDYVSDFNFQGQDSFGFLVDDGIDISNVATVTVAVSRAYRAPEKLQAQCYSDDTLSTEILCEMDEDSTIYVRLSADDLDGFISTGGLDTFTFTIVDSPINGQLTFLSSQDNAAAFRFTPNENFFGDESFTFEVFDGQLHSEISSPVVFHVAPVPDPAVVDMPTQLKAARGFNQLIAVDFSDPDLSLNSRLGSIDWGDGVKALPDDWQNSGRQDADGNEISPQINFAAGSGMLVASHIYNELGTFDLVTFMDNQDTAESFTHTTVDVIEATRVTAVLSQPAEPIDPDSTFMLQFDFTNQLPDGWEGVTATSNQLSFELPDGLAFIDVDSRCSGDKSIICNLGDLAPGETTPVIFQALVNLESTREFSQYTFNLTIRDDGPHVMALNKSMASIRIADTDGDGMPDSYETAYNLNPNDPSDANADLDGDGLSNVEEFRQGSDPSSDGSVPGSGDPGESSISVVPATLSNSTKPGSDAPEQTFEIWNPGEGAFNYTIACDAEWLSCEPDSGTSDGASETITIITVKYATAVLTPDLYTATVTISETGSGEAPIEIPVTLTVADPSRDGGYDVTSELWAKAVLEVPGSPVTLIWKMVGADITPSGDQVVSGYFYADPNDFAYGSQYNPEVFVKIYIATNGWSNMAFSHVTVDDVSVSSMSGGESQSSTATLDERLAEHQYNGVSIDDTLQTTGEAPATSSNEGYTLSSGLWARAALQPASGAVNLIWKEVGADITPSGDKVVSGYFYASPEDFPYGSLYNPEVFVKVYIASSGWANMAFNHVTVDAVDIFSAHNFASNPDRTGTATIDGRLVEHQYEGVSLQ